MNILIIHYRKDCCKRKEPKRYDSRLDMLSNLKESLVYDTYDPPTQSQYEALDTMVQAKPPLPSTIIIEEPSKAIEMLKPPDRSYSVESLYETWLAKLHIIDKELANEFSVSL